MTDQRRIGVPSGHTEYIERITRTVHPDGTVTDSPPERAALSQAFKDLQRMLARENAPAGTRRVLLQRTVTTTASAWAEIPRPEPTPADVKAEKAHQASADSSAPAPHQLAHTSKKGDILGLCKDGWVRNVGDNLAVGELPTVGTAGEDMPADAIVVLIVGKWFKAEETT